MGVSPAASRDAATRKTDQEGKRVATISRRGLVRGAVAATAGLGTVGILRRPANAAEFTYKFGNNLPVDHPMNKRVQEVLPRSEERRVGKECRSRWTPEAERRE